MRILRTRRVAVALVVVLIAALGAGVAFWRSRQHTVAIQQVRENLYLIVGSGMNVTMLVTDGGVVLVDTMHSGWWSQAVLDKVRSVTDKPITTIINTNSHPGHSGNNAFFTRSTGAPIRVVSHENTRLRLVTRDNFKGDNAKFLPTTSFQDRLSLVSGKHRIELYYFGAANTDGDAWVVFPDLGVAHAGDVVTKDDIPEFERISGGSGVVHANTLAQALAGIKGVDTVIVGHGIHDHPRPMISWQELQEHQRLSTELVALVRDAKSARKSAAEAATSIGSTERFARYEPGRLLAAVKAIYDEMGDKALSRR
jgi:glyoxylase-like metal-dependent hydrolase (beta-lactamase superfamily II)